MQFGFFLFCTLLYSFYSGPPAASIKPARAKRLKGLFCITIFIYFIVPPSAVRPADGFRAAGGPAQKCCCRNG